MQAVRSTRGAPAPHQRSPCGPSACGEHLGHETPSGHPAHEAQGRHQVPGGEVNCRDVQPQVQVAFSKGLHRLFAPAHGQLTPCVRDVRERVAEEGVLPVDHGDETPIPPERVARPEIAGFSHSVGKTARSASPWRATPSSSAHWPCASSAGSKTSACAPQAWHRGRCSSLKPRSWVQRQACPAATSRGTARTTQPVAPVVQANT